MSALSDTASEAAMEKPALLRRTRPFYWSVRRELWENRHIYLAPLVASGIVLLGYLLGATRPAQVMMATHGRAPHPASIPPAVPILIGSFAILVTALIVGVFYCLAALHNERRDRSILFWKSLPVSNLTTVLSKAAVPMAVLPVVAFVVIVAAQIAMMAMSSIAFAIRGEDVGLLWSQVPLLKIAGLFLYGLVTLTFWYAPVWAWLLAVSAWARKMTFLWGVGPPLALAVFERLAFGTRYVSSLLNNRLGGDADAAFDSPPHGQGRMELPTADPVKFLSTPGLWVGLLVAVALITAAVWLRRRREPI